MDREDYKENGRNLFDSKCYLLKETDLELFGSERINKIFKVH